MPDDIAMPWGKHRGAKVCALPTDYIRWVLANMESLPATLASALRREKLYRQEMGRPSTGTKDRETMPKRPAPPPVAQEPGGIVSAEALARAIKAAWNASAKAEHPDRGGTHEGFCATQRAFDRIKDSIKDATGVEL